ncbi:MAG: class A beta-lactamase-related serine hydrolase, partial [Deltaproteobacteria bacterium]|nr:class A beta-lactamase-related serine hydrolase [Deltaproteobacteria bacterium]
MVEKKARRKNPSHCTCCRPVFIAFSVVGYWEVWQAVRVVSVVTMAIFQADADPPPIFSVRNRPGPQTGQEPTRIVRGQCSIGEFHGRQACHPLCSDRLPHFSRRSTRRSKMASTQHQVFNIMCVLLLLVLSISGSGCTSDSDGPDTKKKLQRILSSEWEAFSAGKANFGGGLALQVLSLKGDYFMSTDMGEDMGPDHRFRTASVTKTFTAAAVMFLAERGLLDIDDRLTDSIPGQGRPYVPDTPDYDIPNKNQMTIRMVLMHRAGIFDLSNQNIEENEATKDEP